MATKDIDFTDPIATFEQTIIDPDEFFIDPDDPEIASSQEEMETISLRIDLSQSIIVSNRNRIGSDHSF